MSQARKTHAIILTQEHKSFLSKYFDRYLECESGAAQRALANTACDAMITQFGVVRKEQAQALRTVSQTRSRFPCSLLNDHQRVISFLYDRLYRPKNNIRPKKFGIIKKITGRILWANANWELLKPLIDARRLEAREHLLTAYHRVTKQRFNALGDDRLVWNTKAKQLKAGTASLQTKARLLT